MERCEGEGNRTQHNTGEEETSKTEEEGERFEEWTVITNVESREEKIDNNTITTISSKEVAKASSPSSSSTPTKVKKDTILSYIVDPFFNETD